MTPADHRGALPVGALRLAASIAGIVAGAVAAFYVNPLADALEQTPIAMLRRAPLGPGLLGLAVVLGYHLIIALLSVPVATYTPDWDPGSGGDDPAAAYPAFLTFVLFGFSLLAVTGATFVSPAPPGGPDAVHRGRRRASGTKGTEVVGLGTRLGVVAGLSWMCGILFVPAMVFDVVTGSGVPLVPDEQTWILACGLILAMPVALVALIVVAGRHFLGWTAATSMTKHGFGPSFLLTSTGALLCSAILLSQLGRVFPRGMVTGLTLLAALIFALVMWRLILRRARRSGLIPPS